MSSVIVVDPHPVTRRGIVDLLRGAGHDVVHQTGNGIEARDAAIRLRPDMLLAEVAFSGHSMFEAIRALRARHIEIRIILLASEMSDEDFSTAQGLEVDGMVLKSCPEDIILRCVDEVSRGRSWIDREILARMMATYQRKATGSGLAFDLSDKEQAIAALAAVGKPNRQIAESLGIAEGTVKVHLYNIFRKVGVKNRTELARSYDRREADRVLA